MRTSIQYLNYTFDRPEIKSGEMAVDTSLNGRTLDVDTMTATVKCTDPSILNFAQDTPVTILRGGSQYALFYLKDITQVGTNFYTLSLMSSLGRLAQMPHKGGIYNGTPAGQIISDICGNIPYSIQSNFVNIAVYGYLPYVSPSGDHGGQSGSAKDNLLRVLFAIGASLRDDAAGVLRIENLSTEVLSVLDEDSIYLKGASVVQEPPITSVSVLEYQYIASEYVTVLFDGTAVAGQTVVFFEPMHSLEATGFTITESGANYAILSAGTGTLIGKAYTSTTREVTKPVTSAPVVNAIRITDSTLVGITNSADVVNRLVDYYQHRTRIKCDAIIDFEDAGDVVQIWDPFARTMRSACIESIMPLSLSNTMRGTISALVGFTPWQTVPFEDVREVLTGGGTWIKPDGVTDLIAILIGGGNGGTNGADGADGEIYPLNSDVGAAGGAAGQAGAGAKVLRVEIDVANLQNFYYNAGAGGSSGGTGRVTFIRGTGFFYTSNSGQSSPDGYYDAMSGETYALPGVDGTPGGDGSSFYSFQDGNYTLYRPGPGQSVERDGVTYRGGYSGDFAGTRINYATGGGGGGAAVGSQGGDGTAGRILGDNTTVPGAGGNGTDAAAIPAKTVYGCGGDGGHGGGGGGKAGQSGGVNQSPSVRPGTTPGLGGKGSAGGAGAPGCIILYYRRPIT